LIESFKSERGSSKEQKRRKGGSTFGDQRVKKKKGRKDWEAK